MSSRPEVWFGKNKQKVVCLRIGLGNICGNSPENTTGLVFGDSRLNLKR